jgi:hypothetical protein
MNGTYCIVDNGSGSLTERDLGNGSAGLLLTSSITSSSTSLAGSVRTTQLQRPRVGLNANYYTFPAAPTTIGLIWARGSGSSFVQHSQRGSTTITLTSICNIPVTTTPGVAICSGDSALVFGEYVKTAGVYYDTLSSVIGCDSVLSAVITINSVDTALVYDAQQPYSLTSNATNATFQWLDCTSGQLLQETSNMFIAQTPGSYAGIITQNGCTDTTQCYTLSAWSLNESSGVNVVLYPNPAQGFVYVKGLSDGQFQITDLLGKVVLEGTFENGTIDLAHIPRGIYHVELQRGDAIYRVRLAAE